MQHKITPNSKVQIPALMHPLFRTEYAIQRGVERKLLFRTWGGLGDQICAEPTLRYALRMFKDCEISLASECPELFSHLDFKRVYDLRKETPNYDNYFLFDTITPPDESNLVWCFMSHMLTNCVDFPSLCSLRLQLPVESKEIHLDTTLPQNYKELESHLENGVVVHPGKHWQSKTLPKWFWDETLREIKRQGATPILIGHDMDDNRGTVDVDVEDCIDLRNKLSVNDSIWLLHQAKVLLTNDSSPLHMAASGNAWIGCIATVKHPDMISHFRNGIWQWREVFFNRGGIWDVIDFCPNKSQSVEAEFVDPALLESWLPKPFEFATWAVLTMKREKENAIERHY